MTFLEYQAATLARALLDTAMGGTLAGLKVDLTQSNVAITPNTLLATLVAQIATFDGYAQGVVTWDLPSLDSTGAVVVVGNIPVWRPTDGVVPNTIYDAYATLATGGALAFAGLLDGAPIPLASALNQLQLIFRYYAAAQSMGVVVV
jgi:hypothetical protein